jgi:E3 ubiquitin-protein ligase RNF5
MATDPTSSRASGADVHPSMSGLAERSESGRRAAVCNNESSTSGVKPGEETPASAPASDHSFICNICLVAPDQPVVTVCGHLYCWGCLYKWLGMHRDLSQCPVCKAGIELPGGEPSKAKVIPLYVNGRTSDPRESTPPEEIPQRPPGERPESHRRFVFPVRMQYPDPAYTQFHFVICCHQQGWQAGLGPGGVHHSFGNVTLSAGFGLFPSLFGITFVSLSQLLLYSDVNVSSEYTSQGPMGFPPGRNDAASGFGGNGSFDFFASMIFFMY